MGWVYAKVVRGPSVIPARIVFFKEQEVQVDFIHEEGAVERMACSMTKHTKAQSKAENLLKDLEFFQYFEEKLGSCPLGHVKLGPAPEEPQKQEKIVGRMLDALENIHRKGNVLWVTSGGTRYKFLRPCCTKCVKDDENKSIFGIF